MKPKKQERTPCDDFFRMRLEEMLNHRHELYRLAGEIEWSAVDKSDLVICIQRKVGQAYRSD